MSSGQRQEETPLLFLFLDDTVSSPSRGAVFENNARYHRISNGVSSVFKQWPGHVTSCFLVACAFFVFLFTFLAVVMAHLRPMPYSPHCAAFNVENRNSTHIYIVHLGSAWDAHQLRTIEDVILNYPGVPVQLLQLGNQSTAETSVPLLLSSTSKPNGRYKRVAENFSEKRNQLAEDEFDINIGTEELVKTAPHKTVLAVGDGSMLYSLPLIMTLDGLLKQYPIIDYRVEQMKDFFRGTPFCGVWSSFNDEKVELAARVLPLWDFGGISMKLPKYNNSQCNASHYVVDVKISFEMQSIIRGNLTSFLHMPEGIVNIDDEVLHMETKTPCHAFLGEIIKNLRHSTRTTTVQDIIDATLKTFCLNHDVADDFCNKYLKMTESPAIK